MWLAGLLGWLVGRDLARGRMTDDETRTARDRRLTRRDARRVERREGWAAVWANPAGRLLLIAVGLILVYVVVVGR